MTRVMRDLEARIPGATRTHDTGKGTIRPGAPSGLIDVKKTAGDRSWMSRVAGQVDHDLGVPKGFRDIAIGDEVNINGTWRQVTALGFRNGMNYVGFRDDSGQPVDFVDFSGSETLATRVSSERVSVSDAGKPIRASQQPRMDGWRRDAAKPPQFRSPTRGEARLARAEADVRKAEEKLKIATKRARARALRAMPTSDGYDTRDRARRAESDTWAERSDLKYQREELAIVKGMLARGDPSHDQPSVSAPVHTGRLDPARPLAVYGDLLHAQAEDRASFRHLADLEKIPAPMHALVAGYMYQKRAKGSDGAGIWVGSAPVPDLDHMSDLRNQAPRGWRAGKTWDDVDGAHRSNTGTLVAGHSSNADIHGRSAVLHEFGHALDYAVGQRRFDSGSGLASTDNADVLKGESWSAAWRKVHAAVAANADSRMNPYFIQPGDAGPQEMWAEAFGMWARARAKARTGDLARDDPTGYVDSRVIMRLKSEFGQKKDNGPAVAMNDYFKSLAAELGVEL